MKKEIFQKFIETHEVLVVDKNASSRNRLLKIMVDLGCKRHMIHTAGDRTEAEEIIKSKNIGIVLSEYLIGNGSGFDLFKMLREKETSHKTCLVLVTSNISQSAVAKAAEEDVDSFIIKPYTLQSIQENLITTVADKIQPPDYLVKIAEGKELIAKADFTQAISILKSAIPMHPRPALAYFYIGQAEYLQAATKEAEGTYQKGLNFNSIHFKCLIGLYEMFLEQKKSHEAYQVVKKIVVYFPANPERMTSVVRLAIQTGNFQDMQTFYEIFTELEERTPQVINYIGAGMFVSAKYFLMNNDDATAQNYFYNIAVSCSEFTKFTRGIITLLVDYDKVDDAKTYLTRFPPGSDSSEDFKVSEFLILSRKLKDPNTLVKRGLDIYNAKIRDYHSMMILVKAMQSLGYKEDKVAPFKEELRTLWPEKQPLAA